MPGAMRQLKYLILQASVRTPGHLSQRLRGPE